MDRLDRVAALLRKGIRALLWTNAVLAAVLVAAVASMELASAPSGNDAGPNEKAGDRPAEQATLTAAAVTAATTGKAVFRTNATVKTKTVDELSHFQLQGFSVRDGQATAYVRDTKLKKTLMKRVGDSIGPYEIKDISEQGVTVKRGAEEALLSKG